jgi:23S rRNA-/tRNA-specific pseudouridylate synthase
MSEPPSIVHRDAELLVLDKPSGLPTTSPDPTEECLVRWAERLDPHAPRLHPSSRLDAEVTGLVTFARTRSATERLLQARERGTYHRTYLCLVQSAPSEPTGTWSWSIGIDPRDPRRRLALAPGTPGAKAASSGYRVLVSLPNAALLALTPHSGRTHQLRVHASAAGRPILGDRAYGGAQRITLGDGSVLGARRVMLHCARLELPDAEAGVQRFAAPVHADMLRLWTSVGGSASDFDRIDALQPSA